MAADLFLPKHLMDYSSMIKVLTLVFPCSIRRSLPELIEPVDRVFLVEVFRDNNSAVRAKFFSDPLIKHLWSKNFINKNPEIVVGHLRRLRSHSVLGEAKYERLMKDMMHLELTLNFKLLPDMARSSENTMTFTTEEKQ